MRIMDRLLEEYMDFINQDEEDRVESAGRNIVDRIIQKYGTTNIRPIIEEQKNWETWKKIAFRRFPLLLVRESITLKEIRMRLGELKRANYPVESGYCKLKEKDSWDCLKKIRRDIKIHLRGNNF